MANTLVNGYPFDGNGYYEWLCDQTGLSHHYDLLLRQLWMTDFYYVLIDDENRLKDGCDLTRRYCEETNQEWPGPKSSCSVLEMLVALAIRASEEIYDEWSPADWFREFIHNLYLDSQTNFEFDKAYVADRLETWMSRKFNKNGHGNIVKSRTFFDSRMNPFWKEVHNFVISEFGVPKIL